MKKLCLIFFLLLPTVALSQGMDQENMQKMMAQIQEMQTCMQTIDQDEIKKLEKDSKLFEAEVKDLCKNGKRDTAQNRALAYSKEVMNAPAMVIIRKCTEKMQGAMQGMMPDLSAEKIARDFSNKHVCDEI